MPLHSHTIKAVLRPSSNKAALKKLRHEGEVPSVLHYSKEALKNHPGAKTLLLSISADEVEKLISNPSLLAVTYKMTIEGIKDHLTVVVTEAQFNGVTDKCIHIDFMAVTEKTAITAIVPIKAVNRERCEDLKRGSEIAFLSYNIKVKAEIGNMPAVIEVDVSDLKTGDIVHAKDLMEKSKNKDFIFKNPNSAILKITGKRTNANEEKKAETTDKSEPAKAPAGK